MAIDYIVPMGHDDGVRIANALEIMAGMAGLVYDSEAGEYTTQSVCSVMWAHRDGLPYGIAEPLGNATACTKIGAHAGWAAPTPGIVGRAAIDPYAGVGPFWFMEANGYVDEGGMLHVTAVRGDGRFKRDGTMGNVWILYNTLYWTGITVDSVASFSISDRQLSGMVPQPGAYLPDGTLRPFMWIAKYPLGKDTNNEAASISGVKPWTRNVSHATLITHCKNATTGYSGKSVGDDWYIKIMFMLKYATKNSQSVYAGCTSYDVHMNPTVAETGVTRVIVSNADAAKLVVGSAVMLGTHTASSTDRGTAYNYDVFDGLNISKIETYDSTNMAVYIDAPEPFDVATTYLLSTAPWQCGACDAVEGDGTRTDAGRTNGHEPFVMQGVEIGHGMWEIIGDVILDYTANGCEPCICYDSRYEASSITANYTHTGKYLAQGASDAYQYPLYHENVGGLVVGTTSGASTTTGLCDGQYTNKTGTVGLREFCGLGYLYLGADAGLFAGGGNSGLANANWHIGSRLSGIGRSRAAA